MIQEQIIKRFTEAIEIVIASNEWDLLPFGTAYAWFRFRDGRQRPAVTPAGAILLAPALGAKQNFYIPNNKVDAFAAALQISFDESLHLLHGLGTIELSDNESVRAVLFTPLYQAREIGKQISKLWKEEFFCLKR